MLSLAGFLSGVNMLVGGPMFVAFPLQPLATCVKHTKATPPPCHFLGSSGCSQSPAQHGALWAVGLRRRRTDGPGQRKDSMPRGQALSPEAMARISGTLHKEPDRRPDGWVSNGQLMVLIIPRLTDPRGLVAAKLSRGMAMTQLKHGDGSGLR
jgi:hypothetical protein